MRIAHEAPLCIMSKVREYTDYDYALAHFLSNPNYYSFFEESLKMGRRVVLDNSIFELGKAVQSEEMLQLIQKLCPTEYIIPDYLEDQEKTLRSIEEWNREYSSQVSGIKIGVVQGKTYQELLEAFKFIDQNCDKIGISFDYSYYSHFRYMYNFNNKYDKLFRGHRDEFWWAEIRPQLIRSLIQDHFPEKEIHLLGVGLPQEVRVYSHRDFLGKVTSVDTSNPVIHGMSHIRYGDNGLTYKLKHKKIADMLYSEVDHSQWSSVEYNIKKFRNFITV